MSSERGLARRVGVWLKAQPGVWSVKVAGSPWQRRGVPDIVGCARGRFFAIELKSAIGRTSPSQQAELRALAAAGAATCVARTLADVRAFMEPLTEGVIS